MLKWKQPIRILFLLLGLVLFSNVVAPPAAEALLIGTKQEIEIGKGVANDLEKKYGLVTIRRFRRGWPGWAPALSRCRIAKTCPIQLRF